MENWQREIEELHQIFETYFLGQSDSLERVDLVLAPDFTIVGPDGNESDREATMAALKAGHGHTSSLVIRVSDFRLVAESSEVLIASYIEHHELQAGQSNHRLSTVVFVKHAASPQGLRWLRVHETWIPKTTDI